MVVFLDLAGGVLVGFIVFGTGMISLRYSEPPPKEGDEIGMPLWARALLVTLLTSVVGANIIYFSGLPSVQGIIVIGALAGLLGLALLRST